MMRTLFGYLLLAAALALAAVVLLPAGQMERPLAEAAQAMAMVNLGAAARRAQLGLAGRERVRASFSVERMVQATLDAYDRLADTPLATGTDRRAVVG